MLSPAEIDSAREDLADLLWERCTISRRIAGEWVEVAADVPCRLTLVGSAVAGTQQLAAADPNANAVLTLPAGTDIGGEAAVAGDLQMRVDGRRFEARMVVPRQAFLMRVLGSVEG